MHRDPPWEEFAADADGSGCDALKLLDANAYDIIVLDHYLPDITGLDRIAKIHQRGCASPIVSILAVDDPVLSMSALKAGACDSAVKTFRYYDQLRQRLLDGLQKCQSC